MSSPFPFLNGETVTEAVAKICLAKGHAIHRVDGVVSPVCPRCGETGHVAPSYPPKASELRAEGVYKLLHACDSFACKGPHRPEYVRITELVRDSVEFEYTDLPGERSRLNRHAFVRLISGR